MAWTLVTRVVLLVVLSVSPMCLAMRKRHSLEIRRSRLTCPSTVKKNPKDETCMDAKSWTTVPEECCGAKVTCPNEVRRDAKNDLCFDSELNVIPNRCCQDTEEACPEFAHKEAQFNVCVSIGTLIRVPDHCCTVTQPPTFCPSSARKHAQYDVCFDDQSRRVPDQCCGVTDPTQACPSAVYKETKHNVCVDDELHRVQDRCCAVTIEPEPCPSEVRKDAKYDVCIDDSHVLIRRVPEHCCHRAVCGVPPLIGNARLITDSLAPVKAGEELLYWCADGYTTDVESCDVHTFEYGYDYNLPDGQNIYSTKEYNDVHGDPKWTDSNNGQAYYWANVESPAACCELCKAHPECSSFSYNTHPDDSNLPWSGSGYQACYLKKAFQPNRLASATVISGYPIGSFSVKCSGKGNFEWSTACKPVGVSR